MFFCMCLLACRCNYLEFFPHRLQESEINFVFIQQAFASYRFVLCIRRYAALYVSEHFFPSNGETGELLGNTYLYLKEQLELSLMPPPSSILRGTIIGGFLSTVFFT